MSFYLHIHWFLYSAHQLHVDHVCPFWYLIIKKIEMKTPKPTKLVHLFLFKGLYQVSDWCWRSSKTVLVALKVITGYVSILNLLHVLQIRKRQSMNENIIIQIELTLKKTKNGYKYVSYPPLPFWDPLPKNLEATENLSTSNDTLKSSSSASCNEKKKILFIRNHVTHF